MGPTDRIKAAHRLLIDRVPFANVEESVIQDGRQVTIRIGHGCNEKQLVKSGDVGWKMRGGEALSRSLLEEMANTVETKVHQRTEAMEQFLHTVLEEKMPEIVLDRVVDGTVQDLRDVFKDMMVKEVQRVEKRLSKISHPFTSDAENPNEEIDLHRTFISFGHDIDAQVRFYHRRQWHTYDTKYFGVNIGNFADALAIFNAWSEVLEWVELMIRKLKAAAAVK